MSILHYSIFESSSSNRTASSACDRYDWLHHPLTKRKKKGTHHGQGQ